jgi:glyoxylase-like metal-dependent hydrolase (beta-lactamase superfamily II)
MSDGRGDRTITLPASLRDAGIHPITMPMPFALAHVHAYALETNDGWAVVDAGFPSHAALAIFEDELTRIVGDLGRIHTVVVSHFHPDHSGLAGWLQQRSGAAVYIHERDWQRRAEMRRRDAEVRAGAAEGDGSLLDEPLDDDPDGGEQIFDVFRRQMDDMTLPEASPTLVRGDTALDAGGRSLRLLWTPGHTPGHLCVADTAENVLFSGDHILGRITPHIGMWIADGTSPLHEFEDSLRKVESMGFRTVLPAHEAVVERPAERIAEILAHHVERRASAVAAIEAGQTGLSGIAARVFAKRWGDPMQRAFATAETLAHLEALVVDGTLAREGRGARASYRLG